MTRAIGGSGAAIIAADTIARLRGLVAVLRYDVTQTLSTLSSAQRLGVYERIERHLAEANEIEAELNKFLAVVP